MNNVIDTDRVERSIVINGSRERVWRALTNAEEFGAWFGVDFSGQSFEPGKRVRGAKTMGGCDGLFFEATIDRIEPQELMSFHWHLKLDGPDSAELPTLVTFTLKDAGGKGVLLTVVESGFDSLPPQHRRKAFELHSEGWEIQMKNVAGHVGS